MAARAEDLELRLDGSLNNEEELMAHQEAMAVMHEVIQSESVQKKKEMEDAYQELFDINISKSHIEARRKELTATKAPLDDFELMCTKLEEWIKLDNKEKENNAIAEKWVNIITNHYLSLSEEEKEEAVHSSNPIVYHYQSLRKFSGPMLSSYRSKVTDGKPQRKKSA